MEKITSYCLTSIFSAIYTDRYTEKIVQFLWVLFIVCLLSCRWWKNMAKFNGIAQISVISKWNMEKWYFYCFEDLEYCKEWVFMALNILYALQKINSAVSQLQKAHKFHFPPWIPTTIKCCNNKKVEMYNPYEKSVISRSLWQFFICFWYML